jgi:hypothetical protein
VHLFRVEAKPGGVCLHDSDAADKALATLMLFFNLFGQPANLAFEVVLLDRGSAMNEFSRCRCSAALI